MNTPRRVAILIEIPIGLENAGMPALRRFLKVLVRTYGIRCLSVLPPSETRTFGNHSGRKARIDLVATVDVLAAATNPDDENAADAKPAGLAKPRKRKRGRLLKGSSI